MSVTNTFTNARDFSGSLVGLALTVDAEGDGRDFDLVYGRRGFSKDDVLTVMADNKGTPSDGSGIRIISFVNQEGLKSSGNASRFLVNNLE